MGPVDVMAKLLGQPGGRGRAGEPGPAVGVKLHEQLKQDRAEAEHRRDAGHEHDHLDHRDPPTSARPARSPRNTWGHHRSGLPR